MIKYTIIDNNGDLLEYEEIKSADPKGKRYIGIYGETPPISRLRYLLEDEMTLNLAPRKIIIEFE